MTKVDKQLLDELIRVTKKFFATSDSDLLPKRSKLSYDLAVKTFDENFYWFSLEGLVTAIFGGFGLAEDATNEDVYKIFAILGYEVV